jgi:hypothetical protein
MSGEPTLAEINFHRGLTSPPQAILKLYDERPNFLYCHFG